MLIVIFTQQFGLFGWGASGPYKKVYEKFGLTGSSEYLIDRQIAGEVTEVHLRRHRIDQ